MLKKVLALIAVLTLFVGVSTVSAQDAPNSPVGAKRVIWIGSDGFGAHYVNWDELPNLKKMRDAGSWTLHMRSVLPSVSAINWETQLVGAPSEMHGFRTWGSQKPDLPPIYLNEHGRFPDIFRVLKDQLPDFRGTSVYSWDGIGYLYDKEAVADDQFCDHNDQEVYEAALKQLATKPTLAFIYFCEPDCIGHKEGWGTDAYQKMLTKIDDFVGKLFKYLEEQNMLEDSIVIFTADHGGTEKGHGDILMEHMEAPFLMCGKGVKKAEITDVFVHYDVAATIAWALGAEQPQCWRGLPILSAFETK